MLQDVASLDNNEAARVAEQVFEAYKQGEQKAIIAILNEFPSDTVDKIKAVIRSKILPHPKEVSVKEVVEILKSRRVIFYTGAGISIDSEVYNMNQLYDTLGINSEETFDDFFLTAIRAPENLLAKWNDFVQSVLNAPPTNAHQALADLVVEVGAQILTENVDVLQERAGVKPLRMTNTEVLDSIQEEWSKDIDYIITIGLSHDDKGLLALFKSINPNGKIIAIDLEQPSYVGNEDYFLKGDCQFVVPQLSKTLLNKEKQRRSQSTYIRN